MHMTLKQSTILLLCTFLTFGRLFAQSPTSDSLTVAQVVRLAVDNHPAVLAAQAGVAAAQAHVAGSRAGIWPEVSGEADYVRIGPVPEVTLPAGSLEMAPANNLDFHVMARETLYDFGRLSTGEDLARKGQRTAELTVAQVKYNLAYRTIETFYSILFLRENFKVIDQQIEALQQHLDAAQKRVRSGSATDFEVLTTQVRISAATNRRIEVSEALTRQENLLRQLTGLPADSTLKLQGDFVAAAAPSNADSLIAVARQELPEAQLSKSSETSAEVRVRLAALGLRPTVSAFLEGGFKNGYFPDLNVLKANYVAGLSLRAPIFNGHLTRHQVQEAQANLDAARSRTRDVERQIGSNVRTVIAEVQANLEKVQNAQPQLEQARRAVAMAEVRYAAGVITNLDLLDAQTALSDAQLALLKAQYDLKISVYALQKAIGQKVW
jgi:outer membrane protein TolC